MPIAKLFLTFLLIVSFTSSAQAQEWSLRRDHQGIQIYQQPAKIGHAVTRGIAQMDSSIDSVLSMMRDSNACRKWLHACRFNQLIESKSPSERLDYTVIDSPYLFADRDMYVYSKSTYNARTKTLIIRVSGRENYDQGKANRVRIKSIKAFWQIKQIRAGSVSVLYQISSDPQQAPGKFLDEYMANSVLITLRNIRAISAKAPYEDVRLPELH